LCVSSHAAKATQANATNILVLYSHTDHSIFGSVDHLESAVRARVPRPVNFFVESLESRKLEDEGYEKSIVEMLRHTYGRQKLDLLMIGAYPALHFALQHRDELFPGVPIVFFMVDSRWLAGQSGWPGVTGVTGRTNFPATIDLALRLHPGAKTVQIITSDSAIDRYWLNVVHAELLRERNPVKVVDLIGLPTDRLLEELASIPSREAVVLFGLSPNEKVQPAIGTWQALERIGGLLPTYCAAARECLGRGGIGGFFVDGEEHNVLAAQLASRVLSGEQPDKIPFPQGGPARFYANWQQLRRWHIPESALPPGSVVLYREPTLWERNQKYILPVIGVIVAQGLLITGLLWQRARKRKAEAVLRESEERFRVMADTTPALIWMCDAQGNVTYLNDRRVDFTGRDRNAGYDDTWFTYIHPDDRAKVLEANSRALKICQPFSTEYRLRRRDGVYRWMLDVAAPRIDGQGAFAGFIGSAIDVTDQKLAQQALERVSGQLIEAQERERTRIARDIHDDICQRLVLLSMELEQANRASNLAPSGAKGNLVEIRKHCTEIVGDLRSLSHQLHSSTLDYLGLVPAIRGLCQEISKQHNVRVEFMDERVPQQLSRDISLCLFRVAQEALHNAAKYSGADRFAVDARKIGGDLQLEVTDWGTGFDVDTARRRGGLGLVSMQERINQVHGKLIIESTRGTGTRILVMVPMVVEDTIPPEENLTRQTLNAVEVK
jgi:PAS domain S-box-containing protein